MGGAAQTPPLGELLQTGARFLMELGQALSPQPAAEEKTAGESPDKAATPFASLLETDKSTGKSCLRIPLPEPEVVNSLVSGLSQLLSGFMSGRNR